MTEQKLKGYFESELTVEQLNLDLINSQENIGSDFTTVQIDDLTDDEFNVKIEHLIMLLNEAISKKLHPSDLNTIAFALMSSGYFYWDNKTEEGKRIGNVIFELDNPEICFDLTIENFKKWKEYLLTGNYHVGNFD